MKNIFKNIAVFIIAFMASVNFAGAHSLSADSTKKASYSEIAGVDSLSVDSTKQDSESKSAGARRFKPYHSADSTIKASYSSNAYMAVRHGNNSAKVEAAAVCDIMDKSFGANAKLYWFRYGWMYGAEIGYLRNRSSVNAFAGYRFTRPRSPVLFETNLGVGMTEQWKITGSAGDISGDVNGEYIMLLATSKFQFSCFGEVKFGVKLGGRFELFASARASYLPFEGKYSDTTNKLILESNGKQLQVLEKSAEDKKELLDKDFYKVHCQVSLGVSFWF